MKRLLLCTLALAAACNQPPQTENGDQAQPHSAVAKEEAKPEELKNHGREIASFAQNTLLAQVSDALKEVGTVHAINYCNLNATGLMDSISAIKNASVSRIAKRHRNPENYLKTRQDSSVYQDFEEAMNAGEQPQAVLKGHNDQVQFYQPIILGMETCLKCHGKPGTDISAETLAIIEERYPQDNARNFALGDLRGAWKITFSKDAVQD